MMEAYIPNKVLNLVDKITGKKTIDRMERDRIIASILNEFRAEMTERNLELEQYAIRFLGQLLKDRLK